MINEEKLIKFVMSLIRAHYEPENDNDFDDVTEEIARYFDENGRNQLASYIQVLNGNDENVWVPM